MTMQVEKITKKKKIKRKTNSSEAVVKKSKVSKKTVKSQLGANKLPNVIALPKPVTSKAVNAAALCSSNWKRLQLQLKENANFKKQDKAKSKKNKNFDRENKVSNQRQHDHYSKENEKPKIQKLENSAAKELVNSSKKHLKPIQKLKIPNKTSNMPSQNTAESPPTVWFDDVDEEDIKAAEEEIKALNETSKMKGNKDLAHLEKENAFDGPTQILAIDCEMVGTGSKGRHSVLARVSIVNQFGKCIYDEFVKPDRQVTDYRTFVSGVRPEDLENGRRFKDVRNKVRRLLKGRILVGHAIENDLKVLFIKHPKPNIRDTARYHPFRALNKNRSPSLKMLSEKLLGIQVQRGEHSSIQDAQATMRLYMTSKNQWERSVKLKIQKKNVKSSKTPSTRKRARK